MDNKKKISKRKKKNELKELEVVIKVEWAVTIEAKDVEDLRKKVKEQWKEDYNIDLSDDEISTNIGSLMKLTK